MSEYLHITYTIPYSATPGRPVTLSRADVQRDLVGAAGAALGSRLPGATRTADGLADIAGQTTAGAPSEMFPSYQDHHNRVGPRDHSDIVGGFGGAQHEPVSDNNNNQHQYQAPCPLCSFVSRPAYHPAAYAGCWAEIDIHM